MADYLRSQREVPPGWKPPKRTPIFQPPVAGRKNDPVPLPTRKFPAGYAKTPSNGLNSEGPQLGKGVGRGSHHPQSRPQPQPQTTVAPVLTTRQKKSVTTPVVVAAQNVAQTDIPNTARIRMAEPDPATVVVQNDVRATLKNHKTFFQGRAYICNEPAPVTASIKIIVQSDLMEDQNYPLAQWTDYLHMEKCLVVCFEVSPGVSTAHCLEFQSTTALAKFAERFKSFLDDRNKETSSEPGAAPVADSITAPVTNPVTKSVMNPVINSTEENLLLDLEKPVCAVDSLQQTARPEQSSYHALVSTDASKAAESKDTQGSKSAATKLATNQKSLDVPSVLQAAWKKSQAMEYNGQKAQVDLAKSDHAETPKTLVAVSSHSKTRLEVTKKEAPQVDNAAHIDPNEQIPAPSRGEQAITGNIKKAEDSLHPPRKEVEVSHGNHLEAAVCDQPDDDNENTLRKYLLRLRDSVKDLAQTKGLDISVDLDEVFRDVVEAFVSQTSEYYNELDEAGRKGVVQAYCDLAMKPEKSRRRSYSPEQLLDMRNSAKIPSESDMHLIPPSPKAKTPSDSPVLSRSSLSGSAAAFVPSTPKPHPGGTNLSEQIKRVAANAAWAIPSSNPPTVHRSREEEKPDKTGKHSGLGGSRWADSATAPVANPGNFTGPLRYEGSSPSISIREKLCADKPIEPRLLIANSDGSSDLLVSVAGSGVPQYTGAAKDLTGLNLSGPFPGHTADLEGLAFDVSSTEVVTTEVESTVDDHPENDKHVNEDPKAKLEILPNLENKAQPLQPTVISPTSVSSIGGIEFAFQQMRISEF